MREVGAEAPPADELLWAIGPPIRHNLAKLLAWLHEGEGVPLVVTDDVNVGGLAWHGMGGSAWGSHPDCPGEPIKAQRGLIVSQAVALAAPKEVKPMFDPALVLEPVVASLRCKTGGVWLLAGSGAVYAFECPFYGAANGQDYFAGRKAARLEPNGDGYTIVDTAGERYSYP